MTLNRVTVFAIFCTLKSKAENHSELDYYYLDTVGTQPNSPIPQDGQDAQAIIDSKMNADVISKILLNRDKIRRININKEITNKDKDHPLLPDKYVPQYNSLNDLYFTLTNDENTVLSKYLKIFFYIYGHFDPWVTIGLVLTKDMMAMRKTYDTIYGKGAFKDGRKHHSVQTYENMLRVWIRQNREPNENGDLNQDAIQKDLDALIAEYNKGGWYENRDQIELILMKKSIKYAREVIKGFEKAIDNCSMVKIINDSRSTHCLNGDLADAYSNLARYIKNRYQYMADLMRGNSEGSWDVWMLCIAVTFPEEYIEIDKCFRNSGNQDVSLSQFIKEKMVASNEGILASMVSQIVDVTNEDPSKPPTDASNIPPVVPTQVLS